MRLDLTIFYKKLLRKKFIKSILIDDEKTITIIYHDGFKLFIRECIRNPIQKFQTFIENDNDNYFYDGFMPHFSFQDLYDEIERMGDIQTRTNPCKYPYNR